MLFAEKYEKYFGRSLFIKRKFLSVLLALSLALSLLPTAALAEEAPADESDDKPAVETVAEPRETEDEAVPQEANGEVMLVAQAEKTISTSEELVNAINNASDGDTITVSGEIAIDAPLVIKNTVSLTGGSIVASDAFKGFSLVDLETADKTLTLGAITLDAKKHGAVVYCNAGKVIVNGAIITGGKTSTYVAGVYMTSNSQFEMNSGSITGNEVGNAWQNSYTKYAADLWIGANANGALTAINGGTIGNIFVNANEWSANNPGGFTMTGGEVTNLYVEYDSGYGGAFTYNGGTIENLYISTKDGTGNNIKVKPVAGVAYKGGQTGTDVTDPVAQVGNKTYATLADAVSAVQDGETITLLNDFNSNQVIANDGKNFTIDMNGKTVTASENGQTVLVVQSGIVTVTGDGKFTGTASETARGLLSAWNTGTLIFNNSTIDANGVYYGITAFDTAKVEINGGTITAAQSTAVSTNGSANGENFSNGTALKITEGTLTGGNVGVYVPAGTFEISGGTISGDTGVAAKGGKLTITGGTISGTGAKSDFEHNGNGWNSTGDGLAIESCDYPYGSSTVSIQNATITSKNAKAVATYATEGKTEAYKFISGGTFSTEPDASYLKDGYSAKDMGNGTYKVGQFTDYTITFKTTPANAVVSVINKTTNATVTPNADGSYTLNTAYTYEYTVSASGYVSKSGTATAPGEITVTLEREASGSSGGSHSSGSSSNTTTTTKKNSDGSTSTTVTNKSTGTVTETTKRTDGSTSTVETKKNGTVTETNKTSGGTTGTTVTDKSGNITSISASVSTADAKEANKTGDSMTLPVEVPMEKNTKDAPTVKITVPSNTTVKVEIPVEKVTPGAVAVIVDSKGNETLVPTSVVTENGVELKLNGDTNVKIIDNAKTFVDVPVGSTFYNEIASMSAREIMVGRSETVFDLYSGVTLNQISNVAGRICGAVSVDNYQAGLEWAAERGLATGDKSATRMQVLLALYIAAGSPASDVSVDLSHFKDAANVPGEALNAVLWAVQNGILKGTADGLLNLGVNVTRGQSAALAGRALKVIG